MADVDNDSKIIKKNKQDEITKHDNLSVSVDHLSPTKIFL